MITRKAGGWVLITGAFLFACQIAPTPPVMPEETNSNQENQPAITEAPGGVQRPLLIPTSVLEPARTAPSDFEIQPGFPLQIPRSSHTITMLQNGKVLLVGGSLEPDDFVADEELFDPITGTSNWTAPLHMPRHGHTATLLPDGRVLVVGGYSQPLQWLTDAEVYDPATDIWTVIPPHYPHGTAHTATRMKDGRVLVVGGCIGSGVCTESVEIFDPYANSWIKAAPLLSDRYAHTTQLLQDGNILVAGGVGAAGRTPLDGAAVIYSPQQDAWIATGHMITPRQAAESVLLKDGRVLVTGGISLSDPSGQTITDSAEIYDPETSTWESAANLSQARYGFILVLLPNGKVLAIGGVREANCCSNENSFVREIEMYDPATNHWSIVGDFPQSRAFATGILLPYGRIWVAGGRSNGPDMMYPLETWMIVVANP